MYDVKHYIITANFNLAFTWYLDAKFVHIQVHVFAIEIFIMETDVISAIQKGFFRQVDIYQ